MAFYNGKKVLSVVQLGGKFGIFNGEGKTYGTYYPKNEGLDAYSAVIYTALGFDKAFIEGSSQIKEYGIDENISNICAYALSSFSALEKVVIYNTQEVITIDQNAFINTPIETNDGGIYVPDSLLSAYQTAYPNWTFKGFSSYDTWEVPYIQGETSTTLTSEYLTEQLNKLYPSIKGAIRKVVIPTYFTNYEGGVLDIIFDTFISLYDIESPWLRGNVNDGMDYVALMPINGQGTLTNSYLQAIIDADAVAFSKTLTATKVKIGYFESYNNIATSIHAKFPNLTEGEVTGNGTIEANYLFPTSTTRKLTIKAIETATPLVADFTLDELYLVGNMTYQGKKITNNTLSTIIVKDAISLNGNETFWLNTASNLKVIFGESLQRMQTSWATWVRIKYAVFEGNSIVTLQYNMWNAGFDNIYVKANLLMQYMVVTNWTLYADKMIGYLDYIDTIPTFSGYTDTWYEDEDCTQPISTTDFVSGNRYFVKLTEAE